MECLPYIGSTSSFFRIGPGVIIKRPMKIDKTFLCREAFEKENQDAILIERKILEKLGKHPRIVPSVHNHSEFHMVKELISVYRYLGEHLSGILLSEASHGTLQAYIDSNHADMPTSQRLDFCEQLAEAIVHLHSKGVIHSDMRPDNVLVHQVAQSSSVSLWLNDFGGSTCDELQLDGGHLPDIPFGDPRLPCESTPATDIFSLGTIFNTIMTGHWPFMNGPPDWKSAEDRLEYMSRVETLFEQGDFPAVSDLTGGVVIKRCWEHQYNTAEEVLHAVRLEREAEDM